jgi:hypothetical protein
VVIGAEGESDSDVTCAVDCGMAAPGC